MIQFQCPGCRKIFSVADSLRGRKGKCKACGAAIVVEPMKPVEAAPLVPKLPMRTRRLIADAEQMRRAFRNSPIIRVQSMDGDPPDVYRIAYTIASLDKGEKKDPFPRDQHEVEIQLTADYPRLSPKCRMLTPIFHPNIDATTICIGDHWTAGERLADLAVRIGEMIAYQAYNIKSPLNAEAAMWADLHQESLPTDPRPIRPSEVD